MTPDMQLSKSTFTGKFSLYGFLKCRVLSKDSSQSCKHVTWLDNISESHIVAYEEWHLYITPNVPRIG